MAYQVMTKSGWIEKVKNYADDLRSLIAQYHPSRSTAQPAPPALPITAGNAEIACENVREKIREEEPGDPLKRFDAALAKEDVNELMHLLNGAWFGVPESTGCWSIRGFGIACDLMDDPPEE